MAVVSFLLLTRPCPCQYVNYLKTFCEEDKVNPMSSYDFQCLVCLENIDPECFGGRNNLVSAVQRQGIKKCGSTATTTVSEQLGK